MAKKLTKIAELVESKESNFLDFLQHNIDTEALALVKSISVETNVYIFSGVIRNFFLNIQEARDLDIIIDKEVNIDHYFPKSSYYKNSFGGYKATVNNFKIDMWFLRNTWALNNHQTFLHLDLPSIIPATSFFNFSSILYSLNEGKFFYTKYFLQFLRDKKIDIVFKPNPNIPLCIVNSFYYSEKYHLKLSKKLIKFIHEMYVNGISDFEKAQEKHFGEIKYSNAEILEKISFVTKELKSL